MQRLHQIVETELEAPALAWSRLAYYWGMSALGLGPKYQEYMQSHDPDRDHDLLDSIAGFKRTLTIKERFDRAANFYAYCYQQGNSSAINPPFDTPPTIEELISDRLRSEPKPPPPSAFIESINESVLDDETLQNLWAIGGKEQRHRRTQSYNDRVQETLKYVASELTSRINITSAQLSATGFLIEDIHGNQFNASAQLMDETMSPEVQEAKFGECYAQHTPTGTTMVLLGIYGAYYTMGHNLELAMFDDESKTRLSSTYHAIVYTWRQLHTIYHEEIHI